MLMAFCIPVMASDTVAGTSVDTQIITVDENSSNVDAEKESSVDAPIITVDENSSNGGINKANSDTNISPAAVYITNVDPFIIRSGTSTTCQLYLFWESNGETWNSFRWNQLKVKSTSSLFPTTYATIGKKTVKGVGGEVGTVYVQDISIPTNVSRVKVTSTGFQGYRLTPSPGWFSFTELNDTTTIN